MHISDNKHDFNVRRLDELTNELNTLEKRLEEEKGFFQKQKIKRLIRRINKEIIKHGEEITLYEQQNK